MAELTHLFKTDSTAVTRTGATTYAEVTQHRIEWTDLTSAGFANGDDVIIIRRCQNGGNNSSNTFDLDFRSGTTAGGYSSASVDAEMIHENSHSSSPNIGGREWMWVDRITLATNDAFFTGHRTNNSGNTVTTKGFMCLILKLDDLSADDFRYAEDTSTGDAPTTDTDGASVTLPASGLADDWLVFSSVDWLVDNVSLDSYQKLVLNSTDYMIQRWQGEDLTEKFSKGMVGYLPSASDSAVCKVQYRNETAGDNDYIRSAIFALRLESFVDHQGQYDSTPVAINGTNNVFVETQGSASTSLANFSLTSTGNVCAIAQTIGDIVLATAGHCTYNKVQADGVEVITSWSTSANGANDNAEQEQATFIGVKSLTAGSIAMTVQASNRSGSATSFNFDEHTFAAFSMELASADSTAPNLSLPTAASITAGGVTLGATTDEDNGTSHGIITANGDQSAPTNQEVIDGTAPEKLFDVSDKTISAAGAYTHTALATGLTHNTTYGYAIVHEDTAGNEDAGSRVEGTFTTLEITCAVTGTIGAGVDESDIVTGGKTIILTLTNDTWAATLGADNGITDALIAGLSSDKAGVTGWDAVVQANMVFGDVTRTSATVCTIVLAAEATYDITSNETITITLPASALVLGAVAVVADSTFTISAETSGGAGGISSVISQQLIRKAKKRRKTRLMEKMDHDKSVEEAIEELYGKN